jgi:hypothetical protein
MANLPGSLQLYELEDRFQEALRDSSVTTGAGGDSYNYLKDAYTRIWYKYPWSFRHANYTFTATANSADYTLSGTIDEVAHIFNVSKQKTIAMNKGIFQYFDNYADDNHSGAIYNLADYYEDGPVTHLQFQETPGSGASGAGNGDIIQVFYCKHVIHNNSAGGTATGNMSLSTDCPSFAPQFHTLVAKEALCEAIKNRRDFQAMYQLAKEERDEMLHDMKRRYFTPRRGGRLLQYR